MQAEESKKRLYALARDEAERQRLIAALQLNARNDTMSEVFELLAYYMIIASASFGVSAAFYHAGNLLPEILSKKDLFIISIVSFLGIILLINMFLASNAGTYTAKKLVSISERYAYLITFATGFMAGYFLHSYHVMYSEEFRVKEIAVKACLSSRSCLALAKNNNHGDDIRWFLEP